MSPSPRSKSFLIHELAHFLHIKEASDVIVSLVDYEPSREEQKIITSVSLYSLDDEYNAVPEYVAGRMSGRTYSDIKNLAALIFLKIERKSTLHQ